MLESNRYLNREQVSKSEMKLVRYPSAYVSCSIKVESILLC